MASQAQKVLQWIRHREDVNKELAMHKAEASLAPGGPLVSAAPLLLELADMESHDTALQPHHAPGQSLKHKATGFARSAQMGPSEQPTSEYHLANARCAAAAEGSLSGCPVNMSNAGQPNTLELLDDGRHDARVAAGETRSSLLESLPESEGHPHEQPLIHAQLQGSDTLQHACLSPHDRQPQGQDAEPDGSQQEASHAEPDSPAATQSPTAGDACLGQSACPRMRAQDAISGRSTSADATQHLQQRVAWHTILARRNRPQLLLPAACTFFQIWSGECPLNLLPSSICS